ncbi:MAG: DUF4389 domain-containing protein [Proteobacteria bacterium]|nr:DUF4389 domain-containing protein [Pseudomonadota bacterium]
MTKKTTKTEDVIDSVAATSKNESNEVGSEVFSRIFYTILFALIGWLSLWVFTFVVLIQFGFLLITGKVNINLKGFNQEIGLFLFDMIKYLSFQTNDKPFPFRDWPYDENNNKNNSELNESKTVKANK